MMNRIYVIVAQFVALLLLLTGCFWTGSSRSGDKGGDDTIYTREAAMSIYANEPERALSMLDSAVMEGSLKPYQADLCRARIYSSSLVIKNLDSARIINERLVRMPEVRDDKQLLFTVLEQLIDVSHQREDDEGILHWGRQLEALCHECGKNVEALRTEAEIGAALVHLGFQEEGMQKLDHAIKVLTSVRRFNHLDACIIALKRKVLVLNEERDYHAVIPLAQAMIAKLDDYEKFPQVYQDDSYRMPTDSVERKRYIEFYDAQAYSFIAYASARIGDDATARYFTRLFEQSELGKTSLGRSMISPTWFELREVDKMLAAYDEAQRNMGTDTLNDEYALMLRCRAIVAYEAGDYALSRKYWRSHSQLAHDLYKLKLASKAHEYAARYCAQEQQLALQQSQASASRLMIMAIASVILALLCAGFATYFFRQRRIMADKNRALVEQIAWGIENNVRYLKAQEDIHTDSAPKVPEGGSAWLQQLDSGQLFQFLSEEIVRQHMYLDPAFSRQTIVQAFNINERLVGSAFSQSKYNSLPDFIRSCRLSHACLLLEGQPEMSIGEVATASGFTNLSVFCRDFKNKFTVTPTVYRSQRVNRDKC